MKKNRLLQRFCLVLTACLMLAFSSNTLQAYADNNALCPAGMSSKDCASLYGNWPDWVPDDNSGACGNDVVLSGSDNQQKTWNYFEQQGLDDIHTAAIIGNFQQESGLNPTEVEHNSSHPELPKNSNDPASLPVVSGWSGGQTRQPGWGLAQWTPSKKIVDIAQSLKVTGPIYELGTELQIIWGEMNGTTPTGDSNFMKGFNATNNLADAVQYFVSHFEGPLIVGPRYTYAQQALSRYGGQGSNASPATCNLGGVSPNCQTVTGNARILCDAKQYDPVSYFEGYNGGHQGAAKWHQECPVIGPNCFLDCSGLVNIAVYDVFKVELRENTGGERADIGKYWKLIPFSDIQAGDIMQPFSGHVIIVDHTEGNTVKGFAAKTDRHPQPDQVGPTSYANSGPPGYPKYMRYIGPGSSGG